MSTGSERQHSEESKELQSTRGSMCDDSKRRTELEMYLRHLLGLWPGKAIPVFAVHNMEPEDVSAWQDAEHQLLVDEGRRQLDVQRDQLEQVRGRAQFLFTTCLGLVAVSFAGRSTVFEATSIWAPAIWSLSLLLTALGALGAASVVVARKSLGAIDTTLLTTVKRPVMPELAASYRAGSSHWR